MHVKVLSQWLAHQGVIGHSARLAVVLRAVGAVLTGGKLSLTHIGRHLAGQARVKHQIKAADRLLGNQHLHRERKGIYRAIARSVLLGKERPVIVVDWSDVQSGQQWAVLKAAVPAGGRAISVYERVFPYKHYHADAAHREFLRELHSILPEGCRPIIVTDAGFRGPWFRAVEALGWDWLGRLRGRARFLCNKSGKWLLTRSLFDRATSKPRHLGKVVLTRQSCYTARLYLVRAHKIRTGRPHRRRRTNNDVDYRRAHREPWLLATSLPHDHGSDRRIVALYAKRMQIEETFRDLKCHRWGFGLCYSLCKSAARLNTMLLLAVLASLVVWIVGLAGRSIQANWQLQANTERSREVLSAFFIGRELLRTRCTLLGPRHIAEALLTLRAHIVCALSP